MHYSKFALRDYRSQDLVLQMKEDPTSPQVQKIIARHYSVIRKFWGMDGSTDKQADAYAGLGDLYVSDARYTQFAGVSHPDFALFLSKAMRHFADTVLRK